MFKQVVPIDHDVKPTRFRSSLPWIISIVAIGALLAPLAAEGAASCYAQWCEIMGKSTEVKTPIIDSLGSGLEHARDLLSDSLGSAFQLTLRDPTVALPFAAVLLVVAMAMLRR